jgi:integrase
MHSLGRGLILRVGKSGAGSWVQRLTVNGRRKDIGLGPTRTVSLEQAREWANLNKYRVLTGHPDAVVGIVDMRRPDPSAVPYFGDFARAVVESRQDLKRDVQRAHWMSTFENHCRLLYRKRVDEIRRHDIIAVFERRVEGGEILWKAKPAAAKLALQRLGYVFTVAMGREIVTENPADEAPIRAALPRIRGNGRTRHHKAIPHAELGAFLARLDRSRAAHAAILFLALTTARRTEVLEADWSEVEMEAQSWTIPAGRAKTNRDHVVPLSGAAISVLDGRHLRTNGAGRIFVISRTAVQRVFADSGGMAHGLRSAFRSWCQDTGKVREVAELCLGHRIGSAVEQAYARSTLLEQRRELMSEWAEYLGLQ